MPERDARVNKPILTVKFLLRYEPVLLDLLEGPAPARVSTFYAIFAVIRSQLLKSHSLYYILCTLLEKFQFILQLKPAVFFEVFNQAAVGEQNLHGGGDGAKFCFSVFG